MIVVLSDHGLMKFSGKAARMKLDSRVRYTLFDFADQDRDRTVVTLHSNEVRRPHEIRAARLYLPDHTIVDDYSRRDTQGEIQTITTRRAYCPRSNTTPTLTLPTQAS